MPSHPLCEPLCDLCVLIRIADGFITLFGLAFTLYILMNTLHAAFRLVKPRQKPWSVTTVGYHGYHDGHDLPENGNRAQRVRHREDVREQREHEKLHRDGPYRDNLESLIAAYDAEIERLETEVAMKRYELTTLKRRQVPAAPEWLTRPLVQPRALCDRCMNGDCNRCKKNKRLKNSIV